MTLISYIFLLITIQAYSLPSSTTYFNPFSAIADQTPTQQGESALESIFPVGDYSSDLYYINQLLSESTFYGTWLSPIRLAGSLVRNTGYMYMEYETDQNFAFSFQLFDGQYMDQMALTIVYKSFPVTVTLYNSTNRTLVFGSSEIDYQTGETYGELGSESECNVITYLYLIDLESGLPFNITGNTTADLLHLGIQFQVINNQAQINFVTSILTDVDFLFHSQGVAYFVLVLLLGLIQCLICYLLQKLVLLKPAYGKRISPWTLLILNSYDLYFLLDTAYFFMSYSPIFEVAAIPFAFLAFFYEPRLVWRLFQVHGRQLDNRRRTRLEIKSYFGMLMLFLCLLVSLVVYPDFVYILGSIFLLPQVVQSFRQSQKYRWNFWVVLGLGFPKLVFTIYSKLDPNNLLRITPDPTILIVFVGLITLQCILLEIQTRKPRFGIKDHSAYQIYVSKNTAKSSQELCSICLERLKASMISGTQSLLGNGRKAKMMVRTPCKHEFHLICLTEWLKSKLECPYCRSELPALPEDDVEDIDV